MKNTRSFLGLRLVVLAVSFFGLGSSALAAVHLGGMIIAGNSASSLTASAVCSPTGDVCSSTLTSLIGIRLPFAVTIGQLYAFQARAPAAGSSCAFTVRKSTGCTATYAATTVSCTITGDGALRTCQNTTSTVTAAAGDCLQVNFTELGTCSGFVNWGFEAY